MSVLEYPKIVGNCGSWWDFVCIMRWRLEENPVIIFMKMIINVLIHVVIAIWVSLSSFHFFIVGKELKDVLHLLVTCICLLSCV